jgi:hypothetical protein
MPIEIRETTVSPAGEDLDVVQLHISDAAPDDEAATFVLKIHATVRPLRGPTLAHVQRQAMLAASEAITPIFQGLARQITNDGGALELPPKNPRR